MSVAAPSVPDILALLDFVGVGVFALSGALVASRNRMDLIGFGLLASLTGVGGGTLRDLVLGRPVFWIETQHYVAVCLIVAIVVFFTAHIIQRRRVVVLWADAIGISAYCVLGAELALREQAGPLVAVVMGMMTATFGGLARDIACGETPLILRREIYATCTVVGAGLYVAGVGAGLPVVGAAALGAGASLVLRAGGIHFGWALPTYRARPGRPE